MLCYAILAYDMAFIGIRMPGPTSQFVELMTTIASEGMTAFTSIRSSDLGPWICCMKHWICWCKHLIKYYCMHCAVKISRHSNCRTHEGLHERPHYLFASTSPSAEATKFTELVCLELKRLAPTLIFPKADTPKMRTGWSGRMLHGVSGSLRLQLSDKGNQHQPNSNGMAAQIWGATDQCLPESSLRIAPLASWSSFDDHYKKANINSNA